MLIIALFGAFVLYVALYFFYEAAGANLNTAPPFLATLRNMIFSAPESLPIALLKWGIILFAFYIIGDGILASVRRAGKGRGKKSGKNQ